MDRTNPVDRQQALATNVIHDEDHGRNLHRLQGLYGRVAQKQNELIAKYCVGRKVLDVGAGYGNLVQTLSRLGKDVTGIEIDEDKIFYAKKWYGVDIQLSDFRSMNDSEDQFDTLIFREVLNHLDLDEALAKAFSLTRRRCLIFQGTHNLALRFAKRLYGHREYDQKTLGQILEGLKRTGFQIKRIRYSDILAFPLSGGFIGRPWIPNNHFLESLILAAESVALRMTNLLGLGRWLGFRFLITADKPLAESHQGPR